MARNDRGESSKSRSGNASRFPKRHWTIFWSVSAMACLSLVAVIFSTRFYLKSKDHAAKPEHPQDQVALNSAAENRPIQYPRQDAGPEIPDQG